MAKNKKSGRKSNGSKKQQPKQAPTEESTTTTTTTEVVKQHDPLTNTNTDKFCLDTSKPFFFRYFYHYKLWTGLYMLNPYEQAGFNLFGWVFAICMIMWLFVFANGFRDGFQYEQQQMMDQQMG